MLRALLALPCALLIAYQHWLAAAVLFTIAAISDYYDGRVARAQGSSSAAGGLFDHTTDAAFVTLCLGAGVSIGATTAALPPLIIAAFIQYALDSKVLAGQTLRGNWLGKVNGIAYFVLSGFVIGVPLLQQGLGSSLAKPLALLHTLVWLASLLLCATTALSMLNRARYWLRLRG